MTIICMKVLSSLRNEFSPCILWKSTLTYCVCQSLQKFCCIWAAVGICSRALFNRWFVTQSEVTCESGRGRGSEWESERMIVKEKRKRERGHIRALYHTKRAMHYVLGMYSLVVKLQHQSRALLTTLIDISLFWIFGNIATQKRYHFQHIFFSSFIRLNI